MTSPPFDPSQQYTQMDPQGGANPAGYSADNPYSYGQPPAYGQPPGYAPPPAYGQPPGYGQPPTSGQPAGYPGYPGQPAYPGYGAPMYAAPSTQTNTMAILSLVFAFVFAPLAIVFGHMARKQISQSGEQGSGLATAGLILGYIFTGLIVLWCGGLVILGLVATSSGTT